jgi:hypothetical protein
MQNNLDIAAQSQSALASNKGLRNTYALLGVSLIRSGIGALMGELQWKPDVRSLERLQLMKLNRDKNNLTYFNHTIDEARSIIKEV